MLDIHTIFLRYLALPRPETLRYHWIEAALDRKDGRYSAFDYLAHPWYVKPTLTRRWGPGAWITRLFGYTLPGDDGDKYSPNGYAFAEIGPQALSGKGRKEMDEIRTRLARGNRGGCPFSPL